MAPKHDNSLKSAARFLSLARKSAARIRSNRRNAANEKRRARMAEKLSRPSIEEHW